VAFADGYGLTLAGLALVGVVVAVARRRFTLLALLPFQLALVATYTLFFAEPRYRLPIELLAFPFVTEALAALPELVAAVRRRTRPAFSRALVTLGAAVALLVIWRVATPALLDWGVRLRAAHRWAVTVISVDGRARYLMWAPEPPLRPSSPVAGAPNGVHLRAGGDGPTRVRVALGGGALPAGRYQLGLALATDGATPAEFSLAGTTAVVAPGAPSRLSAPLTHAGGPLTLTAELKATADKLKAPVELTVWISDVVIAPPGGPAIE